MIHGPCGHINKSSPCMLNGTCTKISKVFRKETQTGEDGYPQYRRRSPDDGGIVTQIKKIMLTIENGQRVYFTEDNAIHKIIIPQKTTLMAFIELCRVDNFAKTLLYCEVPAYYVWKKNKFSRRKKGKAVSGYLDIKKDQ
ncbi:ATP-dependent DNA helicase, partial [Trichonephila clavata]